MKELVYTAATRDERSRGRTRRWIFWIGLSRGNGHGPTDDRGCGRGFARNNSRNGSGFRVGSRSNGLLNVASPPPRGKSSD